MKKNDLSDFLASEMDKAMNSDENKQMFSTASMLEKLAFKRVSEQDAPTELEGDFLSSLEKKAKKEDACCECAEDKEEKCECSCHPEHKTTKKEASGYMNVFNALLKISEDLDAAGFSKLAASSALLAGNLISQAKAKKSEKPKKKVDMKARMKKMREMKGKKDGKKDEKKSSKPSSSAKSSKPASKSSPAKSSPAKSSPAKSSPAKSSKPASKSSDKK
jgi:hypothetical protein